jgi:cobalt-zinc-cadmium efflux system membrane fusion protein
MKAMKKTLVILFTLPLLLMAGSCNTDRTTELLPEADETGLPPSLSPDSEDVQLINLTEKEQEELNIQTVVIGSSSEPFPVTVPGVVFNDPGHTSIISIPVNGQISAIKKREGDWVRQGEELFSIQSLEFGTLVSEYLIAFAEEKYQTNRLNRIRQLVEETISSESELEQAQSDYSRAAVSSRAAYSRLRAVGVSDSDIEAFRVSEKINPVLKIYSPISGIVEKNFVEQGQSVNALENLSRILDNRVVLIRGYINPDDARMVGEGERVIISRREDQSYIMEATVSSVNPGMDESSLSVVANIYVETIDGWPKPGENVRLTILTPPKDEILMIPFNALTYDGNDAVVFVRKDAGIYEKRIITIAETGEENLFVSAGLKKGEEVAVTQVFSLKAISRFDIIAEE